MSVFDGFIEYNGIYPFCTDMSGSFSGTLSTNAHKIATQLQIFFLATSWKQFTRFHLVGCVSYSQACT